MIKPFALITLLLWASAARAQPLQIDDAWIKNLPAGMKMRAGYLSIRNNEPDTLEIVAVTSIAFADIKIHQSMENNGMMSMHPVKTLSLPPAETIRLVPGGLHLMMMNPIKPIETGTQISVTIHLDNQTSQTVLMTVRK